MGSAHAVSEEKPRSKGSALQPRVPTAKSELSSDTPHAQLSVFKKAADCQQKYFIFEENNDFLCLEKCFN